MEKKEFEFYQDVKVSVWVRQYFSVEAESKEEAVKLVEKYAKIEVDECDDDIYIGDYEWLYDTWSNISVEENGGHSTIELYDLNSHELIGFNGKS